jgi:hypothetical protein
MSRFGTLQAGAKADDVHNRAKANIPAERTWAAGIIVGQHSATA